MKVLLQGRSARSLAVSPGGDQVKLEATAQALRRDCGVDAVPNSDLRPDLSGYDLVHLFGLTRPQDVWVQARNAQRQGVPFVLSPIYLDVWELERDSRSDFVGRVSRRLNRDQSEAVKALGRAVLRGEAHRGVTALWTRGFRRMQLDVVQAAVGFLPDSRSEWERCVRDLDLVIDDERVFVAPNGVDLASVPVSQDEAPADLHRFEGCVLSVGRIEARKNQLTLIEAMRGVDRDLVLVGPPAPNQAGYLERVTEAAGSRVHILGSQSAERRDWLYKLASVHVLPSWLETTGLSSLEAALNGCAIVVSPNGDTREYFGEHAEYCEPGSAASIRHAIGRALARPLSTDFADEIRSKLTWTQTARKTLEAYETVLRARPSTRTG